VAVRKVGKAAVFVNPKIVSVFSPQNPRIGEVKAEDLIDSRYIRELAESGFFDRIYSK